MQKLVEYNKNDVFLFHSLPLTHFELIYSNALEMLAPVIPIRIEIIIRIVIAKPKQMNW